MGTKGTATDRAHAVTVIALGRSMEIAVNETGLTSSQFRALALVRAGITNSGVLARFLAVRPPTVTTVMQGLVEDGLVARTRRADDRRRVDYELTPSGVDALTEANAAADGALASLASSLDKSAREAALAGLDLWRDALDAKRTAP
ncbi:MAG: MarR family winged helix-turn-helix transcriptional regulator [Acidimicrobiales bacterium]